jgi:hypothetical protein
MLVFVLGHLLTDWIEPQESEHTSNKWKKTAEIFKSLAFYGLLKNCIKLRLISKDEHDTLNDLREKRNDVAHESRTWKNGTDVTEEKRIKSICESAIAFLERTKFPPK